MNNINIAELLKNCPKGTELYSPVFDKDKEHNCSLEEADDSCIQVSSPKETLTWEFDNQGTLSDGGACLLFPSKNNHDWSTFTAPKQDNFNEGDVVKRAEGGLTLVTAHWTDYPNELTYPLPTAKYLAKENGFISLASPKEIKVWNSQTLHPLNLHYSTEKREFIHWFFPFDKVVVRFDDDNVWKANLFSHFRKNDYDQNDGDNSCNYYECIDAPYQYCLPYNEETMRLIGTMNEYKQ